jgi:multiple sugar transport system substrate-binding protein
MRFLWPFGGSLLDKDFKSNLLSADSQTGLKFRQDLLKYMPKGIVDYDHNEAVNALAQNKVSMITEWSAFYATLVDPSTSKLGDCLGIAPEPAGPAGRLPALGGFSLAVNKNSSDAKKAAAYLFIQWVTSAAEAKTYLENGGVPGRMKVYEDPAVQQKYAFVKPMVESWQKGVPQYRPRFAEWPEISEIVAEWGSKMLLGDVSTEDGAKEIGTRMEAVLKKAGYYDGKKQLNQ